MSTTEEATINPDGSTTFNDAGDGAGSAGAAGEDMPDMGETAEEIVKGTDPALYLALSVVAFIALYLFLQMRKKTKECRSRRLLFQS
mmetsp:Transcript_34466/g.65619  ORF Transcript_34466/g.65619 Transcript_34466/m.65619 type:complete len:87 (+) Transcript_34466:168-428(+)